MSESSNSKVNPGGVLAGKVAVVTGASRGIGDAIARRFAMEGAKVVVSARTVDSGEHYLPGTINETVAAIRAAGGEALGVKADLAAAEDRERLIAAAEAEFGPVDILVNNAGITQDNLFLRMKSEQWSKVIDVNLNGVFDVTKAVIRLMVKQRTGKIINISSVVGFTGNPGQVNYSSTKSALVGFTKSLAREVGVRGITVNAVAPGFIDTAMTQALNESQQEVILQQIPLGRMGDAEDIANAVSFLASKEASYITGTILHVNGGMY